MELSRKKPALFKDYKTLYRGRRLWAFLNNPAAYSEPPREFYWSDDAQIIVWDLSVDSATAIGRYLPDGTIAAEVTWGQGVSFVARDVKQMIQKVVMLEKEYC